MTSFANSAMEENCAINRSRNFTKGKTHQFQIPKK